MVDVSILLYFNFDVFISVISTVSYQHLVILTTYSKYISIQSHDITFHRVNSVPGNTNEISCPVPFKTHHQILETTSSSLTSSLTSCFRDDVSTYLDPFLRTDENYHSEVLDLLTLTLCEKVKCYYLNFHISHPISNYVGVCVHVLQL